MLYRKDIFFLPKEFPLNLFITNAEIEENPELHFHDCLELNYILKGSGYNYIEDKKHRLTPGDLYVINHLERHLATSDGDLEMLVIIFDATFIWNNTSFDYDYLKPFFDRNIHFTNLISQSNLYSKELSHIILEISEEWAIQDDGYRLIIKASLMKLLALLYRHFNLSGELKEATVTFRRSYERIKPVIDYLHQNYPKELNLKELANVALMNKTYFSTYFKEVMQVTVFDFLAAIRINAACHLLKSCDNTVVEISTECGFSNLSTFNNTFKKIMNQTPSEYRFKYGSRIDGIIPGF